MITRSDSTLRNAAGLVAAGSFVPSTRLRGDARYLAGRPWLGQRMQSMQATKQLRDVESRHNPGAGPVTGATAR
jgi:hypothetical protein